MQIKEDLIGLGAISVAAIGIFTYIGVGLYASFNSKEGIEQIECPANYNYCFTDRESGKEYGVIFKEGNEKVTNIEVYPLE